MYGHRENPTNGQCSETRDEDKEHNINGDQEFKSTVLILVLQAISQQPGKEMEQHKPAKTVSRCGTGQALCLEESI